MDTDPGRSSGSDPIVVLTPDECWELLGSAAVGRLAVSDKDRPDIFPVNFVVDHGAVVFRTANGTKLAAAVLSPAVAFEADGYDADAGEAWSVVIKGPAIEVDGIHGLFAALQLPLFPWHASRKNYFVRIVPERITGRRFRVADPGRWHSEPPSGPLPRPGSVVAGEPPDVVPDVVAEDAPAAPPGRSSPAEQPGS